MIRNGNNSFLQETNQAIRLAEEGRKNEALSIYDKIIERLPDNQESKAQFVRLCIALGNAKTAINLSKQLIQNHPGNAAYMGMLGDAYVINNQLLEAENAFQQAIELDPNMWEAHADLGSVYGMLKLFDKSIEHLEKVVALKPSHTESLVNLTTCLVGAGRHKEALEYGKKAIRSAPSNPIICDNIGSSLSVLGQINEAISYYEKAIALDKSFGTAYMNLSRIKKFSEKDKPFIEKIEKQLKTSLPAKQRMAFHFTLGKAYDDCHEYEKAFMQYRQANLLAQSQHLEPIDNKHLPKLLKKVFTKERLDMALDLGHSSDIPVFIVGMPRTGSSLIEQIISRHSQASGAGELEIIHRIAEEICTAQDHKNYVTEWTRHLNQSELNGYAESYLKALQKDRGDALRITDKLPDNYIYLGFIHLLFPNAKIIHSIRNPLDTCLSCYFQAFTGLNWTFDIESIAKRYQQYRQIMDYWINTLPPGTMMDVSYEALINNQEKESRKLIAHCGLDWEEGCLNYMSEQRDVKTASLWQVRQPIYKTSLKRWSNYASHLEPLAKGLAAYLDDEDIELLKQAGIKVKSKGWW